MVDLKRLREPKIVRAAVIATSIFAISIGVGITLGERGGDGGSSGAIDTTISSPSVIDEGLDDRGVTGGNDESPSYGNVESISYLANIDASGEVPHSVLEATGYGEDTELGSESESYGKGAGFTNAADATRYSALGGGYSEYKTFDIVDKLDVAIGDGLGSEYKTFDIVDKLDVAIRDGLGSSTSSGSGSFSERKSSKSGSSSSKDTINPKPPLPPNSIIWVSEGHNIPPPKKIKVKCFYSSKSGKSGGESKSGKSGVGLPNGKTGKSGGYGSPGRSSYSGKGGKSGSGGDPSGKTGKTGADPSGINPGSSPWSDSGSWSGSWSASSSWTTSNSWSGDDSSSGKSGKYGGDSASGKSGKSGEGSGKASKRNLRANKRKLGKNVHYYDEDCWETVPWSSESWSADWFPPSKAPRPMLSSSSWSSESWSADWTSPPTWNPSWYDTSKPTPEHAGTVNPTTSAPTSCEGRKWRFSPKINGCSNTGDRDVNDSDEYTSAYDCCMREFGNSNCDSYDMCAPTPQPSRSPTKNPTFTPTPSPTVSPTHNPTESPTSKPTMNPTMSPTSKPTRSPTLMPSLDLTPAPSSCEERKWYILSTNDVKQCTNGYDIPEGLVGIPEGLVGFIYFNTLAQCCSDEFVGSECEYFDVCAPPENLVTMDPTLEPSTLEPTLKPTPMVTFGSTPTVSKETSGPPTMSNDRPMESQTD